MNFPDLKHPTQILPDPISAVFYLGLPSSKAPGDSRRILSVKLVAWATKTTVAEIVELFREHKNSHTDRFSM